MRCALYCRVSTSDQNPALQLRELTQFVKARKWKIVEKHQDVVSGAAAKKPGMKALMESARLRRIDCILVWKLDRFGRSLGDLVNKIQELDSLGVRFLAITQGIDTDKSSPTSRLLLNMMAVFADFERELIRERVQSGVDNARAKGVRLGRPLKVFNRPAVQEMRNMGLSIRAIAARCKIGTGTVHRLLRSKTIDDLGSKRPITKKRLRGTN